MVGGFLLGFAASSLIASLLVWRVLTSSTDATRIDTSRPTVVRHVQQLQRLETVVFGMDKIVSGEKGRQYLPQFLVGDRLLLIVYGEVAAGVDLGRLEATGVIVNGKTVRIDIPEAEIFFTRLDNERTRVYSRVTGLFTRVDPNLETELRREAEDQIRQAALDGGILQVAAENARTTLTSFLRGLGFDGVEVH